MKFGLKCLHPLQSLGKGLLIACLISFSSFTHADNTLSLEEIGTMARMCVKVAFSGELEPHVVTTDMTPSRLTQAEMLDLSNLSLHTLPSWLSRFTKLRDLNLAKNALPLEELDEVKAMRVLEVLDLSGNPLFSREHKPLTEFFTFLPNLRVLSLQDTNGICGGESYGDFKNLQSLQKLDIGQNCIYEIDLANFSSTLQELDLSYNYLFDGGVKFVNMPALQKLSIQKQGLDRKLHLPDEWGDAFMMQQLRVLDYDENVIIPDGLERKLESWKSKSK